MEKGQKGYIDHKKKLNLGICIGFVFVIILLYVIGLLVFKTRNNYCTLVAVILVLPFAKFLVNLIICFRAKAIDKDFYEKIRATNYPHTDFDLILSNKQNPVSIEALALDNNTLYLYTRKKIDENFLRTNIKDFLSNVKIDANVNFISSEEKFIKELKSLNLKNRDEKEIARTKYLEKQILNMCV
ncbi:hypothetical protein [Lachnospira multipara]|uniref:Uncharacterized protein n=1 Tax=Lachnospira multipara TaxID=28051 RepID=A0A1H5RNT9_9FIRM|nr:hypothetical protein [Lachnospira multipara]SEF39151.1 hypothetical protein SAMN05216537_101134 [Lachnospira multipara]